LSLDVSLSAPIETSVAAIGIIVVVVIIGGIIVACGGTAGIVN